MKDFSEKQGENVPETDETGEFSTVFSSPAEHMDEKLKSPKKRRIFAVISSVLAVCVLVGGTLAVIKFIPKKDDEQGNSSGVKTVTVVDFDKSKFDTVTVNNENGEFVFYPESKAESDDSSGDTENKWYLKGVDKEKVSASKIETTVSSAAKITATAEITQKTFDECGLNSPAVKVSVASSELGDFSLAFGDVSPDNFGMYLYSSIDEKIYLVSNSAIDDFVFTALDFASTDAVPAVSVTDESKKYVDDNGTLISFDKMEISGGNFSQPVTIAPLSEDEANVGLSYKVTSPVNRYAEANSVSAVLGAFSSGISVSGVYSFDTDAAAISKFGLDKPDTVIKISVSGQNFTYKFAKRDDGFYALFGDGMNTVKKISPSAAAFLSYGDTDFYSKFLYIRSISEIKNMTFNLGDAVYSFDISENDDEADEKYTVYFGDKRITSGYFQNFYMHFVSVSLVDFSYGKPAVADMTVKITDNGGAVQTLAFYKASATEYYCSVDNSPVGKITSAVYNKLVSDIKTVSQNKDVSN